MHTVKPQNILLSVAAKAGLDITDGGLAALQRPTVLPWLENLAEYLSRVWTLYPWPELCQVEYRRFFDGTWQGGISAAGSIFWHNGSYWRAKVPTTTEPGPLAVDWEVHTSDWVLLPLQPQQGEPIGELIQASVRDLNVAGIHAPNVTLHRLDDTGYRIPMYLEGVWVRYRVPYPGFRVYVPGDSWAKGEGVYSADDGSFWIATQDHPVGAPAGNNAHWQAYAIPRRWNRYLVHKVYAAWLRSEKRIDEASIASNQAERAIDEELLNLVQGPALNPQNQIR